MRGGTNKRLLVVEDDRPIAELLKHHFTSAGYTVTTTPDGDEALILIDELVVGADRQALIAREAVQALQWERACVVVIP